MSKFHYSLIDEFMPLMTKLEKLIIDLGKHWDKSNKRFFLIKQARQQMTRVESILSSNEDLKGYTSRFEQIRDFLAELEIPDEEQPVNNLNSAQQRSDSPQIVSPNLSQSIITSQRSKSVEASKTIVAHKPKRLSQKIIEPLDFTSSMLNSKAKSTQVEKLFCESNPRTAANTLKTNQHKKDGRSRPKKDKISNKQPEKNDFMDTDGVVFDTLDTQMKECFVSGQKTTRDNQINSDDPNATQLNSDAESIEAKPPNQKEKTNCLKWRFDYPKESEMIPLSLFPPNWWDALCRNEQWAINILKDDLKF